LEKKESHEKLKIDHVEVMTCCYAHSDEDHDHFHRRSYWLLDSDNDDETIVLVHYLDDRYIIEHPPTTNGITTTSNNGNNMISSNPNVGNGPIIQNSSTNSLVSSPPFNYNTGTDLDIDDGDPEDINAIPTGNVTGNLELSNSEYSLPANNYANDFYYPLSPVSYVEYKGLADMIEPPRPTHKSVLDLMNDDSISYEELPDSPQPDNYIHMQAAQAPLPQQQQQQQGGINPALPYISNITANGYGGNEGMKGTPEMIAVQNLIQRCKNQKEIEQRRNYNMNQGQNNRL